MLTPLPWPERPEDASQLLASSLDALRAPGPADLDQADLDPAGRGQTIPRDAALGVFRRHMARAQQYVQDGFEAGTWTGLQSGRLLGQLTDGVVAALHDYATRQTQPDGAEPMAVAATGGYGRGVLAPFSDIDLLFITRDTPSAGTLATVEFILYFLWDLGLKVGHATRSVTECLAEAGRDMTIRTSLIDARRLSGDTALFDHFQAAFLAFCAQAGAGPFIVAKQAERDARHRRYGESPFLVEPNIKEGRGGLRDLQTLYWMTRYVFGTQVMGQLVGPDSPGGGILTHLEAKHARRSWDFLWTVRFHLHYVAGRAEDRLTFDLQPVVGARMGYTRHGRQDGVERFMRHYFLTAREITRITTVLEPAVVRAALGPPALEAETDPAARRTGLHPRRRQAALAPGFGFEQTPIQMFRILQVARDRGLQLHPLALRALIRHERQAIVLRGDPDAAAVFQDLLCGPEDGPGRAKGAHWLTVMNECGLLGRYIPDWARIVGQMQFDTYHVFTVDEHTIEAVRVLNALEQGELSEVAPIATGLCEDLQSRRSLYSAMLLHDIAKGRGGDHSELGAELALQLGPQIGLSAEETETVSWLVLHHLLLSQTAFKRDIDDPKTIMDLADTIQSPERLKLLLVLTVADMRAVSAKVWNGWKATLLRELYSRVADVLAGGLATTERDVRVARAKEAVSEMLADWPAPRTRVLPRPGIPRLLAELRPRDPRTARPPRPRRRGTLGPAHGRHPTPPGPGRDRGDRLHRGPRRAVQPHRRRAGGGRRQHRGRPHPHPDQRQRARHLLDPGRRRRRLRRPAPPGPAPRPRRTGPLRPPGPRQRDPPGRKRADRPADARHPRAAPRGHRQPGQQHPHGAGGERPRPPRPAARRDGRHQRTGAADRIGARHHLRRPRRRRVLREGRVRPEGGERTEALWPAHGPADGIATRRRSSPRPALTPQTRHGRLA